ncbi:ion transporter [Plantactinospora sp. B5E13]|uniref:ion transporter n=1 Tax=unclassified Plantactinospora TaxID=2631981 RepID=UPI00325F2277
MRELPAGVGTRVAGWCTRIVEADWFHTASFGLIIVNAVVLGLETYDRVVDRAGGALLAVEYACFAAFAVELLLRFGARLTTPGRFFRDGWNVFDLVIVAASLVPGARENVTLLRLLRLARVVRAVRLFPGLRVIIGGVLRSLPGLGGFLMVATLTIYLYAMVGWITFGEAYPERYGTVGQAMLTLFLLLSLDGITDTLEAGRLVSEWSILYYASYVVVASYLLTNLLVGIVIKALEEAHQAERPTSEAPAVPVGPPTPDPVPPAGAASAPIPPADLTVRLRELRAALDALESDLARQYQAGGAVAPQAATAGRPKPRRRAAKLRA